MFKRSRNALAAVLLAFICSSPFAAQLVNVNTADAVTLAENLNGIGTAKAQAIIEYRKLHGKFNGVDDLIKVKGIGTKLVERNNAIITFGNSVTSTASADEKIIPTATGTATAVNKTSTPALPAAN